MGEMLLRNPDIKPTPEIIADGLGDANPVYTEFIEELKGYDVELMDWRYYNDEKAWLTKGEYRWTTPRGTNKVKPLFWVSIWEGFFKISFNFSAKTKDELLKLPISEEGKALISNTEEKGKTMKYIPIIFDVDNRNQLENIFILMAFRKENI